VTQLHQLSATQQLEAMRAGNLSPVELTEHYLDRVARFNQELGAFVTVTASLAREEAQAAEQRYLRDPSTTWPALLGLPVPVKDLHATRGVETASGTAAMPPIIPTADAWTVGLIRSAGAVLTGKSHTSEFGLTCYTENSSGLTAVTPFDTNRYSSGSSGGAATAVSAGLAPVAHGSDGAGSIRTPASATGLVGYKPSR
jgi:amidase